MSHSEPGATIYDVALLTHGILFFGSPADAGPESDAFAALSLADQEDSKESPAMVAMRRDARWLQRAIQLFKGMATRYRMIYIRETSGVTTVKPSLVGPSINFIAHLIRLFRWRARV
jgi:hypothetical protein